MITTTTYRFQPPGNTLAVLLLLLSLCLCLPRTIRAQQRVSTTTSNDYTFSASSGTYTPLTGGTNLAAIQVDDASTTAPIGFTFTVGCSAYATAYISSNGTIAFHGPYQTQGNAALTGVEVLLAPLWDNLGGQGGGSATYITTGTAPNRVFTMEWKDWKWNSQATTATISFQVKLYETSNRIEYIYSPIAGQVVSSGDASIGFYDGASTSNVATAKQQWLTDVTAAPSVNQTITTSLATLPATGQVYTFTNNNTCAATGSQCLGATVFNLNGGTGPTDGLEIFMTGAGNIQIKKDGLNQVYRNSLMASSLDNQVPGTLHGLVLSVGNTFYKTGSLSSSGMTDGGFLTLVSNTCQTSVASGNNYTNRIVLSATKGNLTYLLTLTYSYTFPNRYMNVDYKVTIPAGNTEVVRLSQGWDTLLGGIDAGPGFLNGNAPNLTMGVFRDAAYEAFQYITGVPWSGYYSAHYNGFPSDLGSTNTFKNIINPSPATDNGIGISVDFGTTPGIQGSNSNLIFECNAPKTPPTLSATTLSAPCTANLTELISSTVPAGVTVQWRRVSDNSIVSAPVAVAESGQYYGYYLDTSSGCTSPSSQTVILTLTGSDCALAVAILSPAANATTTTTPTVSGTATPGARVVLTGPGNTTLCSTTATASGSWSCVVTLLPGSQTLTAIASNTSGSTQTSVPLIAIQTRAGTIDCSKTKITPAPVAGTASQVDLVVTVNVSSAGVFSLTVSGSGMSLANGITSVIATTTGLQTFHIPLNYSGAVLGTLNFTIGSAGSCSADLTKTPKREIVDSWTLDCIPTVGPTLR